MRRLKDYQLKKSDKIYFMGIGGTGMAAAAGLLQEAGYKICGSDAGVYPPMSEMLISLRIPYETPYSSDNVRKADPNLIVVANVLSRGNAELEFAIEQDIPLTSFPELLGQVFFRNSHSVVVTGTHGKTTTASAMAHILNECGQNPGFLIGGVPKNFAQGFRVGGGRIFVVEGDEYDTAFFDKDSKFHHYHPSFLIVNNIEFDHADIFRSIDDIYRQFERLIGNMAKPKNIIANVDDPGVAILLHRLQIGKEVTTVATEGKTTSAKVVLDSASVTSEAGLSFWTAKVGLPNLGTLNIRTTLSGSHNLANLAMISACLDVMADEGAFDGTLKSSDIEAAITSFSGVKRRLEHLGHVEGIDAFEDFAHHPTAIEKVLEGFRKANPDRRLVVAFEPRSATQRRNVFLDQFADALKRADVILIGECPVDLRIPADERMNTQILQQKIGPSARTFPTNEALLTGLVESVKEGDAIIFMSSGSFAGVQHKLIDRLKVRRG